MELICSDGLGGNDLDVASIISKDVQRPIFFDAIEAKVTRIAKQKSNLKRAKRETEKGKFIRKY